MRTAAVDRTAPLVRALLIGTGLAAAWVALSLVASPSSASAEERPDGLLGAVGSVVGVVDDTLDEVVDEVVGPVADHVLDPVVSAVVTPISGPVGDVADVTPAPLDPITTPVVDPIADPVPAAGGIIDAVDSSAIEVVSETGSLVADIADLRPVGAITTPVVDTVDGLVGSLPIVGSVLGEDTLGGVLGPVAGVVDDTLDTIVGDLGPLPDDGLLPSLPVPDGPGDPGIVTPPPSLGDASVPEASGSGLAADAGPPGTSPAVSEPAATSAVVRDGGPPGAAETSPGTLTPPAVPRGTEAPLGSGAPAGSSASGSGSGSAAGSDTGFGAIELDALASLVLSAVDDALPSSPVYDTDTTPD